MSCNPCTPKVKILKTGSSLKVGKSVAAITTAGSNLKVTNTDGSTYELELPKAEPANVSTINILNATGEYIAATVAVLN